MMHERRARRSWLAACIWKYGTGSIHNMIGCLVLISHGLAKLNNTDDDGGGIAGGQCYEAASGNPENNCRINLGNMTQYIFSKSRKEWTLTDNSNQLNGRAF